VNITRLSLSYWMMFIWVFFYPNFYNISNRLVGIAENRRKTVENRQKQPKYRQPQHLSQPDLECYILVPVPNFKSLSHTVPEILLNYTKKRLNTARRCTDLNQKFRVASLSHLTARYIPNFKSLALTVLEIFCLQTDRWTDTRTNGWNFGFRL
jgi:hypothetical protein